MTRPIVLRRASRDRLELGAPLRPRAGLLVGVVMLLASGLPLLSPDTPKPIQLGVTFVLAAVGIWLVRASLDRGPALTVEQGVLHAPKGPVPLSHARSIALTGRVTEADGMLRGFYAAELLLADNQRTRLLEHEDPARVLKDLSQLLVELRVPVSSGWGLSGAALSALLAPADQVRARQPSPLTAADARQTPTRTLKLEAPPVEPGARRSAVTALLVAGVLLACLFAFFVASADEWPQPRHRLSVILPTATALLVFGLGLFVATRRLSVSYGSELLIETRAFGFAFRRLRVPAMTLAGAWAVSPDNGPEIHVLIATDAGPVAIRCPAPAARELADGITQSSKRSRSDV